MGVDYHRVTDPLGAGLSRCGYSPPPVNSSATASGHGRGKMGLYTTYYTNGFTVARLLPVASWNQLAAPAVAAYLGQENETDGAGLTAWWPPVPGGRLLELWAPPPPSGSPWV